MEQLFLIFSTLILMTGVMVITSINPIHSVFWLTLTFMVTAMIFITLNIDFMALMLIIVYVGAIAMLFLFVIMMLDILKLSEYLDISNLIPITTLMGVSFFFTLWYLNKNQIFKISKHYLMNEWEFNYNNNIQIIGKLLYTDYAVGFMLASLILLVAMIGAIVLTHELGKETKSQFLSIQHHSNNSWI